MVFQDGAHSFQSKLLTHSHSVKGLHTAVGQQDKLAAGHFHTITRNLPTAYILGVCIALCTYQVKNKKF